LSYRTDGQLGRPIRTDADGWTGLDIHPNRTSQKNPKTARGKFFAPCPRGTAARMTWRRARALVVARATAGSQGDRAGHTRQAGRPRGRPRQGRATAWGNHRSGARARGDCTRVGRLRGEFAGQGRAHGEGRPQGAWRPPPWAHAWGDCGAGAIGGHSGGLVVGHLNKHISLPRLFRCRFFQ
jgi:hypothetical protein